MFSLPALPAIPDVIWTIFSYGWTAGAVVLCVIPFFTVLRILVQISRNPSIEFEEDSMQMDAFRALNYDSYGEGYFEQGKDAVLKERTREILSMFAKFVSVSILAKSLIAIIIFCALYAMVHIFDGYIADYYYRTYWTQDDEEEEDVEDEVN